MVCPRLPLQEKKMNAVGLGEALVKYTTCVMPLFASRGLCFARRPATRDSPAALAQEMHAPYLTFFAAQNCCRRTLVQAAPA